MAATRLDLNTASKEELAGLPAIGEDRAETLIHRRPFHSWREIDHLPGFSSSLVEEIQEEGGYLEGQEEMEQYVSYEEEEEW